MSCLIPNQSYLVCNEVNYLSTMYSTGNDIHKFELLFTKISL